MAVHDGWLELLSSAEGLGLWPPRSLTPLTPFWPSGCVCCYVSHANNTMDTHFLPLGATAGGGHLLKGTSWPPTRGRIERQAMTNLQGEMLKGHHGWTFQFFSTGISKDRNIFYLKTMVIYIWYFGVSTMDKPDKRKLYQVCEGWVGVCKRAPV